ncbi:DUF1294 domain-containing protein [Bacillus sp. HMF5848]|uniref:DUF1294 domain-containing protein n=1 Tax=Bacillus sp. HMF5848 TaxID=2495421 RepID=UPI000F77FA19|nr:DUF1294 domain-containing protein [Bacillus sp. HMF5848]RSK28108.1 DUF1294 domain-containing protein [Bacillus sp. HMF5848]
MFLWYIGIVSLISYIVMAVDKYKARRGHWRIAERTLWILALIGGAVGLTLAMYLHHHKTRHKLFAIGLPLLSLVELMLMGLYGWEVMHNV